MALWDFLKSNNNTNTQPLQLVQAVPNTEGGLDAQVSQWQPRPTKLQNFGNRLSGLLLGQAAPATDNIGTGDGAPITIKDEVTGEDITYNPQNTSTVSQNPRVGGLFRDFASGMNENYNNGFNVNNWGDNQLSDGRNKGFAYRLGEGLGSFTRGLGGWVGDAWTAGYNGLNAGLSRQATRTGDKLYRQQLKDNYGFTDEQLDNTKGYIDANTFNNLTKSQNSAMNLALKQQTTESMNNLRALQAEKLRIMNSTLPEMQKAKLIQENAKAQYAEEMQLARIQAYQNTAALGWGNLGLRLDKFNYDKQKDAQEAADTQKIIDSLGGGSTPPAAPKNDGWAF
jgi:hypothetical protein